MKLTQQNLTSLSKLAQQTAIKAAGYIIEQQKTEIGDVHKKEGMYGLASTVVTQIDLESQRIILDGLQDSINHYDLGLLTEEAEDDQSRLKKDYFWCIDPLDGTLPFIEQRAGFAVSIALVTQSGDSVIGVVVDPVSMDIYQAVKGMGSYRNGDKVEMKRVGNPEKLVLYMDRSAVGKPNYEKMLDLISKKREGFAALEYERIIGNGAVMNAIGVLNGDNSCYVKLPKKKIGGGSIWDFAATKCIFEEAAMNVTNAFGEKLSLNDPHTTQLNTQGVIYTSNNQTNTYVLLVCKELIKS
ncbi:MAG: inositol monophosphatase family protein [Reichenbachiella sp.]